MFYKTNIKAEMSWYECKRSHSCCDLALGNTLQETPGHAGEYLRPLDTRMRENSKLNTKVLYASIPVRHEEIL